MKNQIYLGTCIVLIVLSLFCTLNLEGKNLLPVNNQLDGGNPIKKGIGLTDPHITIHNNCAYLFATHDFSPENKNFVMKDWWIWQSSDLRTWTQINTIKPEDTFLKRPFNDCWATFGVVKDDKWYFYFSAGQTEIGVMKADKPEGTWIDPLGKPLIQRGLTPTEQRDPDIFIDDDGNAYMVYGTFDYFIVKLNPDMISLAEHPRPIELDYKFGPYGEGQTDDKPSLHKYNDRYYLSWSSFYAVSDQVYGPYHYKGTVFEQNKLAPEFLTRDIFHDRHGNFFSLNGQWYYTFNDFSQPGMNKHFRDACIVYIHYKDNGEIAPIRLDQVGVGQYDVLQNKKIEAEEFFNKHQADKRECSEGGFEMYNIQDGSTLTYPHILNIPAKCLASFRIASNNPAGGVIEIWENKKRGKLVGTCKFTSTGGWTNYQTISCRLSNEKGVNDLILKFKGKGGELLNINWFTLE